MNQKDKIDFVVTWVDGSDPAWLRERERWRNPDAPCQQVDARDHRYRDWDNLRYWFRGVETYAPWVNRVHFVTWGHLPSWLNTEHPKLHIVRHADYIPPEYLPTFSSHPIELNLHRIDGLAEQFVYFCDDFFLTAPVAPEDFFLDGLPRDYLEETPIAFSEPSLMNGVRMNDVIFASQHFDRRTVRRQMWKKWYSPKNPHGMVKNLLLSALNDESFFGLNVHHLPQAYRRETFEAVWAAEPELLDATCRHKFRDERDVSHCVFKFWQLLTGRYAPYNKRRYGTVYRALNQTEAICQHIRTRKQKTLCIIDEGRLDFDQTKALVQDAFQSVLPDKSAFER